MRNEFMLWPNARQEEQQDPDYFIARREGSIGGAEFPISGESHDWLVSKLYTKNLTETQLANESAIKEKLFSEIEESSVKPSADFKASLKSLLTTGGGKETGDFDVGYRNRERPRYSARTPIYSYLEPGSHFIQGRTGESTEFLFRIPDATYYWHIDRADGHSVTDCPPKDADTMGRLAHLKATNSEIGSLLQPLLTRGIYVSGLRDVSVGGVTTDGVTRLRPIHGVRLDPRPTYCSRNGMEPTEATVSP